jgi:hypothetical protein
MFREYRAPIVFSEESSCLNVSDSVHVRRNDRHSRPCVFGVSESVVLGNIYRSSTLHKRLLRNEKDVIEVQFASTALLKVALGHVCEGWSAKIYDISV